MRRSAGRAPADRLCSGRAPRAWSPVRRCPSCVPPSPPRAAPGAPNAAAAARRGRSLGLWQQRLDLLEDGVELLVGLALAVAHRQLRVDERRAGGHLEGARLGASAVGARRAVNALRDGDLARILLLEEGGQRGGVLGVPSAASVLDADPELRHGGKGSPDRGGKKRDDLLAGCVLRGFSPSFCTRARGARCARTDLRVSLLVSV